MGGSNNNEGKQKPQSDDEPTKKEMEQFKALANAPNKAPNNVAATLAEKFVGKTFVDTKNAFTKNDLPPIHRIISPGDVVTADLKEDRFNIELDKKNVCTFAYYDGRKPATSVAKGQSS
ncbi:hypothetical protein COEREDRAFT_83012 [Coemansia reversa NRRL 1564]|uniref:Uncharacterized protein n=1 Tax=Coemansia reversa (strain ATCC 12441 / NRRL 1564) TaxID=763665 RepID=A0A2G5B4T7_COERN|nr:hypothetical protein COEREDRAFT_83012 [Coemansia reversa NRRL 1564]|eukprot:PIA14063.1 hypothetical protein COEREDRAFT_83012 [Coemansia reversa NRRL 1564]